MRKAAIIGAVIGMLVLAAPAAAHVRIYHLFSHAAQQHPHMRPPRRVDYQCVPTSDPSYMACCVLDSTANEGVNGGLWYCSMVPALNDRRSRAIQVAGSHPHLH